MAKAHSIRIGDTFGRWTVLAYAGKQGTHHCWRCRCICGTLRSVRALRLLSSRSRSCGCLTRERVKEACTRYGRALAREHEIWRGMHRRCNDPSCTGYKKYGARGIAVCPRWRDFFAFLDDMGTCPSREHSIDRIDNNDNYEPGNCRWATPKEQGRNRRDNHLLTHAGETLSLAAWAERLGISYSTLRSRRNLLHWSAEKTLTTPVRSQL